MSRWLPIKSVHLELLIGLSANQHTGTTAEWLAERLRHPLRTILRELDGLIGCSLVEDHEAELFFLADEGLKLFGGICSAFAKLVEEIDDVQPRKSVQRNPGKRQKRSR